jgi:DNA-binding MarR family transcriptional regulator
VINVLQEAQESLDKLSGKTYLSINEKMVLLGMVKYPELNDRQIAEKINLKLSTFTAIKNRLKKNDYFKTVRIPIMKKLGSELMFVLYSQMNTTGSLEKVQKIVGDFLKGWEDVYYAITESEHLVALGYSQNYTQFRSRVDEMFQLLSIEGILDQKTKLQWKLYPLTMSLVLNNFNHTRIIEDHFGVDYRPKQVGDQYDRINSILGSEKDMSVFKNFTSTETKVLYGLIQYPDLPDNKIALEVGTTRQAVARIKKKLDKKGIISSIKIPNLKKLGFEIISFAHLVFHPDSDFNERAETLNEIILRTPIPVIFHILKDDEATFITAHRNYEEFNTIRSLVYNIYKQKDFLQEEPTIILFSNANLNPIKFFEFGDMVKNALEN